jgi:large subunit ribosomal protein L21
VPIPRGAPLELVRQQACAPEMTRQTTRQNDPGSTKETAVYAIVRSGAIQQKVAVGDVIEIDKVTTPIGESLTLPVLMVVDGEKVTATGLEKAGVTVEVLGATKGPKIIIQKFKNKTGYKKRQGHRQHYTQVKVTDISV